MQHNDDEDAIIDGSLVFGRSHSTKHEQIHKKHSGVYVSNMYLSSCRLLLSSSLLICHNNSSKFRKWEVMVSKYGLAAILMMMK